ncbi:MAG: TIGR03619 family F420-dependent LLM class oxidoreductase [Acidimicrobiales bacterium]|nr:TIGR03619 family F420-dependent LLM class oxidoreductase [Acidimicrobiales bacterium]
MNSEWIYGMQLPIQTLTRTLADPWEDTATVDDLVSVAQKAEATGHSFVGVCDHVAIPDNDYASHMTTTWYDTIATLSFLAAHTNTVNLLSAVWVAAYRHPLQTAKSFGTLDHLSGGRCILGVGAGHVEAEFETLGVDFAQRGKILNETIEAVRGAFDEPYVSFAGDFFNYEEVGVAPTPSRGSLPIWVGGSGKAAWKRTGRQGDGYIPMGASADTYPEIVDTILTAAAEVGREGHPFAIGYMPGWAYLTNDEKPEGLPMAWLVGPEALAADIRTARENGANTFHMKFRGRTITEYLEQLDAFDELVVPLINEG